MNRPAPHRWLPVALLMSLLAGSAPGQVAFRCVFPATQVLQFEQLPAIVSIRNEGTTPLRAGGNDPYQLSFDVTDRNGIQLHARPQRTAAVPAVIDAQQEVVFTNDLQQLYQIDRDQPITVRARLQTGGRTYATEPAYIDVNAGIEIVRVIAPAPDGALHAYTLRTMNRDKKDHLFLRIDDEAAGLCYGVHDLGRFIRVGAPVLQVDSAGRVHALQLSGPSQFTHSVFSADGNPVSQEVVGGDASSVRLEPDGQGSFRVAGGGPSSSPAEPMVEPLPMRRGL